MNPLSNSGFAHAPVSKAVVLVCGISSIVLQASRARAGPGRRLGEHSPLQLLAFGAPAECLFGVFLLYYFRILERQIGSAKYAAFVTIISVLSGLLSISSRTIWPSLPHAPGGPYGLIFASFVQYFFTVPSLSKFSVLGWRLNDKAFIYLAGLQLCLSGGVRTLAAGLAGLVAGAVYRSNIFGVRNFKMPRFICRLASSVGRVLETPPPENAHVMGAGGAPPRGAAHA